MAASMQETFQKLAARYRGKANQLFVIGMGVLLALRVVLFLFEANYNAPAHVEPAMTTIEQTLKTDGPTYQRVHQLTQPLPPYEKSEYLMLGKINVFDAKQMQGRAELEKRANDKYNEAFTLFKQGRYGDAQRAVDETLSLMPSHARAKELKGQITAAQATPAPAKPTPPPAGAGGTH